MTARIIIGDALEQLRGLPAESVQCVVTSPPYWGLRDYGVEGQLGLEKDPRDYIAAMVNVFAEVQRVLRRDGTLWLNMGDCYTDGGRGGDSGSVTLTGGRRTQEESRVAVNWKGARPFGLGPKQLIGMPWRLAFALQEHGWILRSDVIWAKPNPMPESVNDRLTKAHEYVFLFSRSRRYYYDRRAIAEPQSANERTRRLREQREGLDRTYDLQRDKPHGQQPPGMTGVAKSAAARHRLAVLGTRNARTVWTITPRAFTEAHFATFPPALPERCILAGTSPRACELCGAAWRPIYSKPVATGGAGSGNKGRSYRHQRGGPESDTRRQAHSVPWQPAVSTVIDWRASCECSLSSGTSRCLVLDPFAGAGTTGLVADRLGRDSILIELSPEYAAMIERRLAGPTPVPSTA